MTKKFLANTAGQCLSQHLISVGILAKNIITKLEFNSDFFGEDFNNYALLSGIFHDIGKIDPQFQNYISKKTNEETEEDFDGVHDVSVLATRANHQEISWAILNSYDISIRGKNLDKKTIKAVSYAVYWHHKKLIRNHEDYENNIGILKSLKPEYHLFTQSLLELVNLINSNYLDLTGESLDLKIVPVDLKTLEEDYTPINVPRFKEYDKSLYEYKLTTNARNSILRSAVISADRSVSSINEIDGLNVFFRNRSVEKLINRIFTDSFHEINVISEQIQKGINSPKFNDKERSISQADTANKLDEAGKMAVLAGPPGCGKTRIALDWVSKKKPKKIIWVCPRVNICQSIFQELTHEYLPNSKIELLTGEFKLLKDKQLLEKDNYELLSGDFIVTTIDQVLQRLSSNNKAKDLPVLLDSVFVFDEFHEFFNLPGMLFLFKEFIYLINNSSSNYLLMSATPNPFFLDFLEIDGFDPESHIIKAWDFNSAKYEIKMDTYQIYPKANPKTNSIFVYNSVNQAQIDYMELIGEESSLLFHSQFTKEDKNVIFDTLMANFGKNRNGNYSCLRAGPIIQASFNISRDYMRTDVCSPENVLQRFGRCNRFGKNTIGVFEIIKPQIKKGSVYSYLSHVEFSTESSFAFFDFLKNKISGLITRQQLADLYYEFHKINKKTYETDFKRIKAKAIEFIDKYNGMAPLKFLSKKSKSGYKITAGFRGEGVYILPLLGEYDNNFLKASDSYLYDSREEINKNILLTMDPSQIEDLINDFAKNVKHLKIPGITKYNSKIEHVIGRAKNPDFPIYVSYNQEDLGKINKKINEQNYLIYIPYHNNITLGLISFEMLNLFNQKQIEKSTNGEIPKKDEK